MARLAVLSEPRIFPPKRFLLVIWAGTLLVAIYGLYETTPLYGSPLAMWIVIAILAVWQLLTLRWVQVDADGIRMRNILQRGRALRWEEISEFREEEVRLSKHPYVILHLSNRGNGTPRPTKINLTSDQVEFETLRTIVREAVPKADEIAGG